MNQTQLTQLLAETTLPPDSEIDVLISLYFVDGEVAQEVADRVRYSLEELKDESDQVLRTSTLESRDRARRSAQLLLDSPDPDIAVPILGDAYSYLEQQVQAHLPFGQPDIADLNVDYGKFIALRKRFSLDSPQLLRLYNATPAVLKDPGTEQYVVLI